MDEKWKKRFIVGVNVVSVVMGVLIITYFYVFVPHQVEGRSMKPTYVDKELVVVDKFFYTRRRGLLRGDVVVFHAPKAAPCSLPDGCEFIKRVVGLGGDRVEINSGLVKVNGQIVRQVGEGKSWAGDWNVPMGKLFVLGDNFNESSDSRNWGFVDQEAVIGRVFVRLLPLKRFGWVEGGLLW